MGGETFAVIALVTGIVTAVEMRTFTWEVPTARTDGTPLDVSDISSYIIGCSQTSGDYTGVQWPVEGGQTDMALVPNDDMFWGVNYCAMKVIDSSGLESMWSEEVIWIRLPAAPTDLRG